MTTLAELGWDDDWAAAAAPALAEAGALELEPARVAIEHRGAYEVLGERGMLWAELRGKDYYAARDKRELPTVGDWVLIAGAEAAAAGGAAVIHAIVPRRSCLVRAAAGDKVMPQPIAANVDIAFVVTSANLDLNARRVERYLATVRDGGAEPVIVLNKVDLVDDPGPLVARIAEVAPGTAVVIASATRGDGLDALAAHLAGHLTGVVIGSSGVGKSTLLNRLLGEATQQVAPVRGHDDRGRHTTTRRELFVLTRGGVVVDTPGMRELKPWTEPDINEDPGATDALAFDEIAVMAQGCRFADCRHLAEPGCAVRLAVEAGALDPARLASWLKLAREQGDRTAAANVADKRREKIGARSLRARLRDKGAKD